MLMHSEICVDESFVTNLCVCSSWTSVFTRSNVVCSVWERLEDLGLMWRIQGFGCIGILSVVFSGGSEYPEVGIGCRNRWGNEETKMWEHLEGPLAWQLIIAT